jgi:hypothetical protein
MANDKWGDDLSIDDILKAKKQLDSLGKGKLYFKDVPLGETSGPIKISCIPWPSAEEYAAMKHRLILGTASDTDRTVIETFEALNTRN